MLYELSNSEGKRTRCHQNRCSPNQRDPTLFPCHQDPLNVNLQSTRRQDNSVRSDIVPQPKSQISTQKHDSPIDSLVISGWLMRSEAKIRVPIKISIPKGSRGFLRSDACGNPEDRALAGREPRSPQLYSPSSHPKRRATIGI